MIMQSLYSAVVATGADGKVASSFLQKSTLGPKEMNKYPLPLLQLMARYAEDLIWANKIQIGTSAFRFLLKLPIQRRDTYELRKGQFAGSYHGLQLSRSICQKNWKASWAYVVSTLNSGLSILRLGFREGDPIYGPTQAVPCGSGASSPGKMLKWRSLEMRFPAF